MNKYKNKKIWAYNRWWDSRFECDYYYFLVLKEKAREISNLRTQVPFTLINKSKYGTEIKYIADFVYEKNGELVVVDTKGVLTPVYKLKSRLFAERYGFKIKEVRANEKWEI